MKQLQEFKSLPDFMSFDELDKYFIYFLEVAQKYKYDRKILFEALYELSDRQWHCYKLLNTQTKNMIESWIGINMILDDIDILESLLYIVGQLGLQFTYENLKRVDLNLIPKDCKNCLIESFHELGENVADPYSQIRKESEAQIKKN